jgi:signal peptidase II
VQNTGGAFSLFAGSSSAFRLPFFLLVSVVAIVVLLYFVGKVEPRQWLLLLALGGILGGALGNLVDRIVAGVVTDFLDLHWHGYHWPAFNVADSCISTGMVILLIHSLLVRDVGESK